MKVDRVLANHSLSSTASQGTSNIPLSFSLERPIQWTVQRSLRVHGQPSSAVDHHVYSRTNHRTMKSAAPRNHTAAGTDFMILPAVTTICPRVPSSRTLRLRALTTKIECSQPEVIFHSPLLAVTFTTVPAAAEVSCQEAGSQSTCTKDQK